MDKRRIFVVVAVGILLSASVGIMFVRNAGQGSPMAPSRIARYPIPPDNVAIGDGPKYNYEPSVAISSIDPDTIVAGAIDGNGVRDGWCGLYTSHDRGKTWKQGFIGGYPGGPRNALTGYLSTCDPVIAAAPNGDFYYAGMGFSTVANPRKTQTAIAGRECVFVAKSTDNGDSFDKVAIVSEVMSSHIRLNDKPWIAVDEKNGNVYLEWGMFFPATLGPLTGIYTDRIVLSGSKDAGTSWSSPVTISETQVGVNGWDGVMGSMVAVDTSGTIHVTWTNTVSMKIRYAQSNDGGKSFTTPVDIAPVELIPSPLPKSNYRCGSGTSLAAAPSCNGTASNLYVTWPDYCSGDSDILLSASTDGGKSWGSPVRVNNDPERNGADQFFPAITVSAEGWVHVSFYDRRSDPNNTLVEYWWAISFDGGQTFPVNIPLSNTSFDGNNETAGNGDFIGDYTSNAANNETFTAVWCDTRNGKADAGQSDIYGAIVPYKELLKTNTFANVTIPWPKDNKE